jgi:hypothetical protein
MATYPGPKVHRTNRRKLGRGQFAAGASVTCTLSVATVTLTLTFSGPVVVTGIIPVSTSGAQTFVSQTLVSSTVVTQTWSATLVGATLTLPSIPANVSTYQGGGVGGTSKTF